MTVLGMSIIFVGTALGALTAFVFKKDSPKANTLFLGFAAGMPVAGGVAHANVLPRRARGVAAGIALLAVSYVLGTLQLMHVYALDAPAALAVAVVPFVVPDVVKVVASVGVAERVNRALGATAER